MESPWAKIGRADSSSHLQVCRQSAQAFRRALSWRPPQRPDRIADGKVLTLLHFTDTHAQLETHPEYLPGATPEIQMMGGYARLKTAIERERAHCEGAVLSARRRR